MLSARRRPHHALEGLPASQAQNAGLSPAGGRPLPHPAHAHAGGNAPCAHRRAGAAAQRGSVRGHRSRPRSRPHAVRPRRGAGAQRNLRPRLPALRAVAARGGLHRKGRPGAQSLPGNAHRHSCPHKGPSRGEPRGRRRAAVRPCGVSESRSGRRDARRHRRGV